jgi:aquaglyceroporin related protein
MATEPLSDHNQFQNGSHEHVGEWPQMGTTEAYHKEQPEHWGHSNLATLPTADTDEASSAQHLETTRTSRKMTSFRSALGLHPLAPIDETHDTAPHQDLLWSKIRLALREPFSEFLGVMILVLFGNGSVAQVLLSTGSATAPGTA